MGATTTPELAWRALINKLKAERKKGQSLSYVKGIYEGVRNKITAFPVIVVEPKREPEVDGAIYGRTDSKFEIEIFGIVKVHDKNKQIVGVGQTRGILDLKNDILKALSEDHTLGCVVKDVNITDVVYEWRDYPARSVTITVELEYSQNTITRS